MSSRKDDAVDDALRGIVPLLRARARRCASAVALMSGLTLLFLWLAKTYGAPAMETLPASPRLGDLGATLPLLVCTLGALASGAATLTNALSLAQCSVRLRRAAELGLD